MSNAAFRNYKLGIKTLDQTPTGDAGIPINDDLVRIADLLERLSNISAPPLASISISLSAVSGKLSFGASHSIAGYTNAPIDADGAYPAITGIVSGIWGTMNSTVAETSYFASGAFSEANQGTLKLILNDTVLKTVDLTVLSATDDSPTGFQLSAGSANTLFADLISRTGTWTVDAIHFRHGWNQIIVRHEIISGVFRDATTEFVYDASTTPTTFSSETITSLSLSGAKHLSGVTYYTLGTANYGVNVNGAYHNTYSADSSAVSFSAENLIALSAEALPAGSPDYDNKVLTLSKTLNLTGRLIDESATVSTTIKRTVQATATSTGVSIDNVLFDNFTTTVNQDAIEDFTDESRRLLTSSDFDDLTLNGNWDSTVGLTDGLQIIGGQLVYPTVNYSALANGPSGNPDYSGASGERTFYRVFQNVTGNSISDYFTFFISGIFELIVAADNFTPNSDQIKLELRFPSQSDWLDMLNVTGCRVANKAWLIRIPGINSANCGERAIIKITAPEGWTGSISLLKFSFTSLIGGVCD